jgi:hypothetical protein
MMSFDSIGNGVFLWRISPVREEINLAPTYGRLEVASIHCAHLDMVAPISGRPQKDDRIIFEQV